MKNNNQIIFLAVVLAVLILSTANPALASGTSGFKTEVVKIVLAMGGIVFFTVLITIGLSIYNRFFVPAEVKDYNLRKESLRSPADKDEAIIMYLTKNKLK